MKKNERYLNCKYLDAGMDGMLCSRSLCTTCKEFNGKKCDCYTPKNKKKITKTTNWLTKGMTQEEIKKIKEETLREYAEEIAQIKRKEKINEMASDMDYGCTKHDLWPDDAKEIAKALIILGYQKVKEDEVVISKAEYKRLQTDMRRLAYQNCNLRIENKNLEESLDIEKLKGKETATKFYDKFNENICLFELDKNVSEDYKDGYAQAIADVCGRLDDTAKELGVDLEEYYGK